MYLAKLKFIILFLWFKVLLRKCQVTCLEFYLAVWKMESALTIMHFFLAYRKADCRLSRADSLTDKQDYKHQPAEVRHMLK